MWVERAGLKIKSENALIIQLERTFSSCGIANAAARESVTGKHNPEIEGEPTDRGKREGTEEATVESMKGEGPTSKKGKKKQGCNSKKRVDAERLLPLLFDVALADDQQPVAKLEFLRDQRHGVYSVMNDEMVVM